MILRSSLFKYLRDTSSNHAFVWSPALQVYVRVEKNDVLRALKEGPKARTEWFDAEKIGQLVYIGEPG